MAIGDISSVIIDRWASVAYLKLLGLAPGGTYSLGTAPSSSKAVFTVISLGFDSTGAATTKTRTIYGTHQMLMPTGDGSLTMSKIMIGAVTSGPFQDGETITQATSGATAKGAE